MRRWILAGYGCMVELIVIQPDLFAKSGSYFVPNPYVSSIHMTDAGNAVVAALSAPAETFNVVDNEPLQKRDYAKALAAAAGTTAWLHLAGRMALLLGDRSTSLTRSVRVSNKRFQAATGWTPQYPSAREGWLATARVLYPNG